MQGLLLCNKSSNAIKTQLVCNKVLLFVYKQT